MKLEKILVPLDGSALAETALPTAVALAATTGAALLLLRAAEAPAVAMGDAAEAQVKVVREAEEYLDDVKRRLQTDTKAPITTAVWYGQPAEAIAEAAHFNRIGMVVMTTHGRSGLGRLLLGSVAESVIRSTATPILVLHPDGAPLQASSGESRPAAPGCASGWMSAGRIER
jgi:nucleotide-binding universal stress UspA family protein